MPSREQDQAVHNLQGAWRGEALDKIGDLVVLLRQNRPEEEIAQRLGFANVESMRAQLERWGVSGLAPRGDAALPHKDAPGKKRPLKPLKEPEELPAAERAYDLLRQGVGDLEEALTWVRTLKEVRWGTVFETFGHYPGEDEPRARGFWRHPHPHEAMLIVAYLLNNHTDQAIALLLQRLHPRHADLEERREVKEGLAKMLFGDPEKPPKHRGGLFRQMWKAASVVRGLPVTEAGQVKGGRPRDIPEGLLEAIVVREIAALRQEGVTDGDEIVRELREDGWGQYSGLGEDDFRALLKFRPEGW